MAKIIAKASTDVSNDNISSFWKLPHYNITLSLLIIPQKNNGNSSKPYIYVEIATP